MGLTATIQPVSVLKSKSAELIRHARDTGDPIIITQNGRATAVLQGFEAYKRQQERLVMLKLLTQGGEDYEKGRTATHAQAMKRFEKKLQELKTRE
ncbi:MAG: antitoxin, Phd family protein [Armatimonadetes bacterium CG_4_10_14_3_um_filter_66_18]|nr:type II toxin-antitoxin system Phd/YefM family antitoxin [Armatimonadota bacterium]OIP04619.1 MAG: hypothetical protein AUJ96_12340 [Armatimonadetes bacterium CG2_30_66_41]PIU95225.1 MAG: antitoxin, Phd family protein [Armatimonadetes bacterium CG06_land_8_20_14_3_00_66_21]PIX42612.1 MAG: antitoxin, Phd family protein [Armatimonadetes bacterium CG_4_8_14_3_um_filter_66_20]PIY51003.1 MAG: antitoxin, Phd family protein [Armatimonadetes bacterium CG_4_10_14_3_um_filter_66_18]PIZ40081.1 MAG: an